MDVDHLFSSPSGIDAVRPFVLLDNLPRHGGDADPIVGGGRFPPGCQGAFPPVFLTNFLLEFSPPRI